MVPKVKQLGNPALYGEVVCSFNATEANRLTESNRNIPLSLRAFLKQRMTWLQSSCSSAYSRRVIKLQQKLSHDFQRTNVTHHNNNK